MTLMTCKMPTARPRQACSYQESALGAVTDIRLPLAERLSVLLLDLSEHKLAHGH